MITRPAQYTGQVRPTLANILTLYQVDLAFIRHTKLSDLTKKGLYEIAALSNSLLLGLPYMNEMQEFIFRCHARHKKLPPLNYKDLTAKLTVKSRTGHAAVSVALALQDAVLCSSTAG